MKEVDEIEEAFERDRCKTVVVDGEMIHKAIKV